TSKPLDIDVDGRNAYVNNQFISEQEPLPDNTPPLYEILQKQMEKVLSNTGYTGELYAENAQSKEMPEDIQHAPGKPMFSYNLNHFNDYEEEADNENEDEPFGQEEQQQPENCEDTEESLNENDDSNNASQYGNIPTNPSNGYPQNNVPQHSHKPSTGSNKPGKAPYDSSNFNSPSPIYGQSNKPSSSPSSNHQNKPPQSSYGGGQSQQKPSQGNEKPTKPSQTTHHNKPTKPSKQPPSSTSKPNNSKPYMNAEDGADLSNPSSPFSTPNNKPNKVPGKRHMTFRTVSSSTQYVSTPLADLMLKFTLGMAKPGKNQSDLGTQETQVYDKNDI
uniref:Uncharacterized protein n=1 Tax=Stomoxys calcitrans TaxID=35570 RepID=A0A1I8PPR5_STOCA